VNAAQHVEADGRDCSHGTLQIRAARPQLNAVRWPTFLCGRSVVATWWFEEPILSGNSNPSDAEL
jgi:hypothetical protein